MGKLNVDTILEQNGYSKYQMSIISIVFLFILNDGFFASIISVMAVPTKDLYQISTVKLSALSLIVFIGSCTGSFFCGYLSNTYGRVVITKYSILVITVSTFLIAVFYNIYLLHFLFRFFIGVSLGISEPFVIDILVEYLPVYCRTFTLNFIDAGWAFGKIMISMIVLLCMPNYEIGSYSLVFYISTLIPLITTILVYKYLNEGVRTLLIQGNYEDALVILEDMYFSSLSSAQKKIVLDDETETVNLKEITETYVCDGTDTASQTVTMKQKTDNSTPLSTLETLEDLKINFDKFRFNKNEIASILEQTLQELLEEKKKESLIANKTSKLPNFIDIFEPYYNTTSIILSFLWFFCYSSLITTNFIFSFAKKETSTSLDNNQLIYSFIFADLFLLPANLMGGIISELRVLKVSQWIGLLIFIGGVLLGLSQLYPSYFEFFYGGYEFCAVIYIQLVIVYSTEIFPTRIRDVAIGYFFFMEKLGGILLLLFIAQLSIFGTHLLFYIFLIIFSILSIVSLFLKFDPHGKALDQDLTERLLTSS